MTTESAEVEKERRAWACANVGRALNATPEVECEHFRSEWKPATCVGCAYNLGRRVGGAEAGAYLTMAEVRDSPRLPRASDEYSRAPLHRPDVA